jgi:sialate O-acetylesterase
MADAGEQVEIVFLKKKYNTTTGQDGKWQISLPPQKAGGPYTMKINDLELNDILVGDVWLCSGQSNMELPVRRVLDLYADEVKDYSNPMIRYVKTPTSSNYHHPQPDIPSVSWATLTPDNALSYAAICYFFAKELQETLHVPIGIINSSVGGSPIESWISEDGLQSFPHYLHDRDLHQSDEYVRKAGQLDHERRALWNQILYKEDKGLHENPEWYDPAYNDSNWAKTDLNNKSWNHDGSMPVNGTFWFRKDIDLPAHQTDKEAVLRLGCIVDADSVFVNGILVGTTPYQYPPRIYTIPAGILKQGKNNITVRLFSYSGKAEFVDEKPYKLIIGDEEIDLRKDWKYRLGVRMPAYQGVPTTQQKPTGFYNGMIAPLKNYAICGAIWYQGESNTGRYHEYGDLLISLINDWRTLWQQPGLPFLIVQLPNFLKTSPEPSDGDWAHMREAQLKATQTIPNTALAVAIDAGEWNDIHPLNKKDIGHRLSLQAQKIVYGNQKIIAEGPVYNSMEIKGNQIILSFEDGTNDLLPVDELKGFAIAGKDNHFKWAKASIEGQKVIVWNDQVSEPVKVRYAWADNPGEVNLKNKTGLPASPFQTKD